MYCRGKAVWLPEQPQASLEPPDGRRTLLIAFLYPGQCGLPSRCAPRVEASRVSHYQSSTYQNAWYAQACYLIRSRCHYSPALRLREGIAYTSSCCGVSRVCELTDLGLLTLHYMPVRIRSSGSGCSSLVCCWKATVGTMAIKMNNRVPHTHYSQCIICLNVTSRLYV